MHFVPRQVDEVVSSISILGLDSLSALARTHPLNTFSLVQWKTWFDWFGWYYSDKTSVLIGWGIHHLNLVPILTESLSLTS